MLSEEIINEIAEAFREQHESIGMCNPANRHHYTVQLRDDVISLARIIHTHNPAHNMDEFYVKCGYSGTFPVHK